MARLSSWHSPCKSTCLRKRMADRQRKLFLESLEPRQLMAADSILEWNEILLANQSNTYQHNSYEPEDVNDDGDCTPLDALIVINELNTGDSTATRNFVDVNGDGQRTAMDAVMVINRLNRPNFRSPTDPRSGSTIPFEVRSIDGTGNNLAHPQWGSTDETLLRVASADYADGISTPGGADRPSAREISNQLATHVDEDTPNDHQITAYLYVWGQFLDHDLDLTRTVGPAEQLNISVPVDDPAFDPNGTGSAIIPLTRSIYDTTTGTSTSNPRQQLNQITAWIDGSMIYGSDATRAAALRSFSGGKLRVSTLR